MVSTWKPVLAALVIFAAGVVTGAFTIQLRRARPLPSPANRTERATAPRPWLSTRAEAQLRELAQRMAQELDLTPVQRERVEKLLHESQGRMRAIAEEVAPRTREELRHVREQLRAELTPAQRRKLDELMKAREAAGRRPAPPGGAGSAASEH